MQNIKTEKKISGDMVDSYLSIKYLALIHFEGFWEKAFYGRTDGRTTEPRH